MFSIKYEKPVEGKNFAIALTKEMESQNLSKDDTTAWLKKMQEIFPDFSPSDILNFVALADKGYFAVSYTHLNAKENLCSLYFQLLNQKSRCEVLDPSLLSVCHGKSTLLRASEQTLQMCIRDRYYVPFHESE